MPMQIGSFKNFFPNWAVNMLDLSKLVKAIHPIAILFSTHQPLSALQFKR